MPRYSAVACLALCAWLSSCSNRDPVEDAKPVATPLLTQVPSVVASGRPVNLGFRFVVADDAPPLVEDYTVFVHVLDSDGRMIGAMDHLPPTPTREWKARSIVEYTHAGHVPASTYLGTATVVVGLYSPVTGERLPLAGEAVEPRAYKVGSFEMREQSDPWAVVFREGWHAPEAPAGAGVTWRWSRKSGSLSFPNPKRDVELVLEVDQPNAVFAVPQHVEIRLGDTVADGFDLEAGRAQLRRIALNQAQLGQGENVDLSVVTDKTFVPAQFAQLGSSDTRQLGVRVFRIYVEPKQ